MDSLDTADQQQGRREAMWERMKAWVDGGVSVPSWASARASQAYTATEIRIRQDHAQAILANLLNSASSTVDAVVKAAAPALFGFDLAVPSSDLTVIQVAHKRHVSARRARKLRQRGVRCWYTGRTSTGKARFAYWRMQ